DADAITNNPTPDFTGTVASGAAVTLFVNGRAAGTTTASPTGFYVVTTNSTVPLTQGLTNNITITETDLAGNSSAPSPTLVVRLDTTPPPATKPTLASGTGTSGNNITKINTPTFTGTAEISPYLSTNPTPQTDGALVQIYAQLVSAPGQPTN